MQFLFKFYPWKVLRLVFLLFHLAKLFRLHNAAWKENPYPEKKKNSFFRRKSAEHIHNILNIMWK